jgi:hypothetical protein
MIVIHNEYRGAKNSIPLNMDLVLSRNDRVSANSTAIFYYDRRLIADGDIRDVQPDLPPKNHAVA